MVEHKTDASGEARSRRRLLRFMAAAACAALAVGLAACGQEPAQDGRRPDWLRSKQGSNGNGRGRR